MKTPDEIKKWLNDPIHVHYHISDIEPRLTPLALHDLEFLHTDALALIKQLESENAELLEKVEKLKTERDAAVRDLTEMAQDTDESCEYCEMFKTPRCSLECRMKNKGFKWRGVQKEGQPNTWAQISNSQ